MTNQPKNLLDCATQPGKLVKKLEKDSLICTACGHLCKLKPGQRGVCKVRYNETNFTIGFKIHKFIENTGNNGMAIYCPYFTYNTSTYKWNKQ